MKKIHLKLLFLIMLFAIVFVSCKKDENADKASQFTYEGTEYSLSKGFLAYFGDANTDPATYGFAIVISSSELVIDFDTEITSGNGEAIILDLYSSSSTELIPGTYTFDADGTALAYTFDYGIMYIDYDFSNGFKTEVVNDVTAGTIKVTKSGSEYELTIDCTVSGGKKLNGYYKGSLEYHDLSSAPVKSLIAK